MSEFKSEGPMGILSESLDKANESFIQSLKEEIDEIDNPRLKKRLEKKFSKLIG